ncbi:MAG: tetratricopeptide repeat protein [Spirochaetia bacterium]|nr:tetratricopeptide repeat protein [Spirochaetia bacterium]
MKTKILLFLFFLTFIFIFSVQTYSNAEKNAAYYKEMGDKEKIQKNTLTAIEYYKKSISKNSNYVPALLAMGAILRETEALYQSAEYLHKALKINEKNEDIFYNLALTYLAMNSLTEAEKYINEGIKISPQNLNFQYLSARLYMNQGQIFLAEKKLKNILKMNPGHYQAQIAMGEIFSEQKRYHKAEDNFNKALLIDPENLNAFLQLAKIHLSKIIDQKEDLLFENKLDSQIFHKAIDYLLNAKGYDNFYIPANLMLGQIYALTGNCKEAEPYFNTVLSINPNHYTSLYYIGYCFPDQSLSVYPALLNMQNNDEITRFFLEKNRKKIYKSEKHPEIISDAKEHYTLGKNLFYANYYTRGLFEIKWSIYLFSEYIDAHKELIEAYRSRHDLIGLKNELDFMRQISFEKKYQDMFEQLIQTRQNKLYYLEGITNPLQLKTLTPLFIFNFKPENPIAQYPNAGESIAKKLSFALNDLGRLKVFSEEEISVLYKPLEELSYFGGGGYYNGKIGKILQSQYKKLPTSDKSNLRYAISGSYSEINQGLKVEASLINLDTGMSFAPIKLKETGRGFLRNIAISLANHIYKSIPFAGEIIKLSGNGVIVNLGKRDGITEKTSLSVIRNNNIITNLKIAVLDMDILWAHTEKPENIYKIQTGDTVIITPPELKKKKKSTN